jgi:hypothetical protein
MLCEIIAEDRLPDYRLAEVPGDVLAVAPRAVVIEPGMAPSLSTEALEAARGLMPGADVYALEAEWRGYGVQSGRPRLVSADKAFLGWVRVRAGRPG